LPDGEESRAIHITWNASRIAGLPKLGRRLRLPGELPRELRKAFGRVRRARRGYFRGWKGSQARAAGESAWIGGLPASVTAAGQSNTDSCFQLTEEPNRTLPRLW